MNIDPQIGRILERVQENIPPSKQECMKLLDCPAVSMESAMIRTAADAVSRQRFGNEGIILGQIGIETTACPGKCGFCSLAEGNIRLAPDSMSLSEILEAVESFTASGDMFALFLMTTHLFDFERLIAIIRSVRERMPSQPQLVVNIGDFNREEARILREAGVNGAYHICRLREGVDTCLNPENRIKTIEAIKHAELDFYYCCEPIGPEHTSRELVEQLFIGIEFGCFQHAAMRRVHVPGSPLASRGQISELRLAQVTAVVALASLACSETRIIAVHEPNLLGLTSGANAIYAEKGSNPRDTVEDTLGHRGHDVNACLSMLYETEFESVLSAPAKRRKIIGPCL
jgi:biotin synthase